MLKTRWIVLMVAVFALFWAFTERRTLNVYFVLLTSDGAPPPLRKKTDEGPEVRWADDYFTVERVAPATFALGEPRYAQQNYSYLILGRDRALLFDAGPGIRDIRATAESLTDLPITFLPSHFHYDHVRQHPQLRSHRSGRPALHPRTSHRRPAHPDDTGAPGHGGRL